jgi:thioredoxin 1
MEIESFDKKKFENAQKNGFTCLLHFWSSWCGVCLNSKHLESFKDSDKLVVFRVNFEDNEELAEKYSVKMVPSYVFVKDFKVVGMISGIQNERFLKGFL